MSKKAIINIFVIFILLSYAFNLTNKNDYWIDFISNNLSEYTEKIPQQKLYLHLNKDKYYSGNTLWYKAYLLNSYQKRADSISDNIYVEIISPNDVVFMTQLLKNKSGYAHGSFPIIDTIQTGIYQIRAFTKNMKNYGKEFLFSKDFSIINKQNKLFYSKILHKKAKKIKKQKKSIDLQFFPEGGYLIDNIKTNIAFKAINQTGKGINISGAIFSKKGIKIKGFTSEHLGMGHLQFKAEYGNGYYAIISSPSGNRKKYKLPKALKTGYSLNIKPEDKSLDIIIKTNKIFSSDINAKTVYLIAQNGGKIYYKEKLIFNNNNEINFEIDNSIFPTGILHFTLFNSKAKPFAERLIFIDKKDNLNIEINDLKPEYKKRDSIKLKLNISNFKGAYKQTNLSISVKQKEATHGFEDKVNIINYLLLQADLKGKVENPEYYFSKKTNSNKAIDILMQTQAWRKFTWQEVLNDTITIPAYKVEKGINITGKVTKFLLKKPSKDATIELTFLNKHNDVLRTYTNNQGNFKLKFSNQYDSLDLLVEARSRKDKKNVLILIDKKDKMPTNYLPYYGFYLDSLIVKHKIKHRYKKEELDPDKLDQVKLHHRADQTIKFTESDYSRNTSVINEIQNQVAGFNGSTMRGSNSMIGSNQPLYLIDGVPTDVGAVASLNISDVESIDILKGTSAAIYGINGSNGVIAIYTRKGAFFKRGEINFKMLGYHSPKKYYSPKYETKKQLNNKIIDSRKTIYWNPQITTSNKNETEIKFFSSDIAGEFEIIIECMSKDGNIGYKKANYNIID